MQATSVRLVYRADPCADELTLRQAVSRELHADPFGEPARYEVSATVHKNGGRLRAHIELHDDTTTLGARDIEGRDCDELVPAMAWVIALAVEPLLRAPPPVVVPAPEPRAQPEAPKPAPPPPALDVAPPRVEPRRFMMRVGVGIGVALEAGPEAAAAFSLSFAALRPRYSLGFELRGDLPGGPRTKYDGAISTTQAMAMFVPCFRHKIAAVCALGALGLEYGSGSGYAQAQSARAFYAGLGGRVAIDVPLLERLLYLSLHADLLAALTRLELYVGKTSDTERRIYRTPPVSSLFGTTLLIQIP